MLHLRGTPRDIRRVLGQRDSPSSSQMYRKVSSLAVATFRPVLRVARWYYHAARVKRNELTAI